MLEKGELILGGVGSSFSAVESFWECRAGNLFPAKCRLKIRYALETTSKNDDTRLAKWEMTAITMGYEQAVRMSGIEAGGGLCPMKEKRMKNESKKRAIGWPSSQY